ncbi:MAG: carbohydrate ABC transporter permease [Christensenellales bacterium]|jgi:putative aldouronate transport system permease protein
MRRRRIQTSPMERAFTIFNYLFFAIVALLMILPFWHVIMVSFSGVNEAQRGGLFLYPKGWNLNTYNTVFRNPMIYTGFATTLMVTVSGTLIGVMVSALLAYALSKRHLRGGKLLMVLVLFTMVFNGGMIPNYMLVKSLGLIDNRLALVLPGLISAYNVIIMKSYFETIPDAYDESAKIDGANDLVIFFRIILPLSGAMLATVALFIAVGYWNDYFSSVLYINSTSKWSLQAVLRNMLTNTAGAMAQAGVTVNVVQTISATTVKAGSIVVATVPILIVYPFLQKYFVKGVQIGGVKG